MSSRFALLVTLLACGGTTQAMETGPSPDPGPAGPSAALDALPVLPFPLDGASEIMRAFWLALGEALDHPLPPPSGAGDAALEGWLRETLPQWMLLRSSHSSALTEVALQLSGVERDIARVGIAYLMSDTGRMLEGASLPEEMRVELSDVFEALAEDAAPLFARASELFAPCAGAASLPEWQTFCEEQLAVLGARDAAADEPVPTETDVVIEPDAADLAPAAEPPAAEPPPAEPPAADPAPSAEPDVQP